MTLSEVMAVLVLQEDKNMKTIYEFIAVLVTHPYFQCALIAFGVVLVFCLAFAITDLII